MTIVPVTWRAPAGRALSSRLGRHGLALAAVAVGFGLRLLLEPAFGGFHPYSTFLPVVILTAYALGRGPALLALGVSAVLGYACFAAPEHGWADIHALASLGFFVGSGGVAAVLIGALVRTLDKLAVALVRAEGVAQSHAELFRELNERMTIHMQLIAGLLQLHALKENDTALSRAFANASEKSLLISRAHRELSGRARELVDFKAFAERLAKVAPGGPAVEVNGERLMTTPAQATSLGVVLLECLATHTRQGGEGGLQVTVDGDAAMTRLSVSVAPPGRGLHIRALYDAYFLRAMVEQLGGEMALGMDVGRPSVELRLPGVERLVEASAALPTQAAATLH
jgi:two-component sensor histidine kinase